VVCTAPGAPFSASPLTINVPANGSASTIVGFAPLSTGQSTGTLNCSVTGSAQTMSFTLSGAAFASVVDTLDGRNLLVLTLLLLLAGLGGTALTRRN